jgi:DNA-binding CsgD family transcriptional regulator
LRDEETYPDSGTARDIARAFQTAALGQPQETPAWLQGGFVRCAYGIYMENLINHAKMRYYYAAGQYHMVLVFAERQKGVEAALYGKLELKIFEAMSLFCLGRRNEAVEAVAEAYHMAAPNALWTPFIEPGADMRRLADAARRAANRKMPREWLEHIRNRASICSKHMTHMMKEYGPDERIALSKRETEVLKRMAHGLSRQEIASELGISGNTVKLYTNTLYSKLGAANQADAIRIAMENKLIRT